MPRPDTIRTAFDHCERMAREHYENFPVASLLLPRKQRPFVAAVYAFARTADDFADEGDRPASERLARLDGWEKSLMDAARGYAEEPIFIALAETIARTGLSVDPLADLLAAFRMDVVNDRFATFKDLLYYCQHSANPVGRIVLHLFNESTPETIPLSDRICTGLQLANFWQDFGVDWRKGRLYIPLEDISRFGYTENDLAGSVVDQRFRALMEFETDRTKEFLLSGQGLPGLVGTRLGWELRLTIRGGLSILDRVKALEYDVIHHRPVLRTIDKARLVVEAILNRAP